MLDVPVSKVEFTFQTNFFAPIRIIQKVAPIMATNKSSSSSEAKGLIVNIGSVNGIVPVPWGGIYAASKGALKNLSMSLHNELSPFGVRVLHVEPGGVKTNVCFAPYHLFLLFIYREASNTETLSCLGPNYPVACG